MDAEQAVVRLFAGRARVRRHTKRIRLQGQPTGQANKIARKGTRSLAAAAQGATAPNICSARSVTPTRGFRCSFSWPPRRLDDTSRRHPTDGNQALTSPFAPAGRGWRTPAARRSTRETSRKFPPRTWSSTRPARGKTCGRGYEGRHTCNISWSSTEAFSTAKPKPEREFVVSGARYGKKCKDVPRHESFGLGFSAEEKG